jgi:hypothetical protein
MTAAQISIAELLSRGITPSGDEAVAVARALMLDRSSSTGAVSPDEPPLPENVYLGSDGSVDCPDCATTPAISEVALLVRRLVPIGTAGIPGGLHYTIARALQEVDAPAFDSVEDFSDALARFEHGDRAQLLSGLLDRTQTNALAMETAARPPRTWQWLVAAWVTAAATLIATGEAIHGRLAVPRSEAATESLTVPATPAAREAPPHDLVLDAPVPEERVESVPPPVPGRIARASQRVPAKAVLRRASRAQPRHGNRSVFERLHLRWLRRAFTRRTHQT